VLSIYLILGAVFSLIMYYYLDWKIGEYESGKKLEEDDVDRLEEVEKQVDFVGGKVYVIFLLVVCTLFWLPMLIFNPPSRS
jgi:hypothetical protein